MFEQQFQIQMAEKLNISPSAIGMYEQGRRAPSMEMIVELAKTVKNKFPRK